MTLQSADWLKRQRQKHGFRKQESLARELGLSRSTVGNWESGRGGPKAQTVPLLASLFNVSQQEVADVFRMKLTGDLPATPAPPWAQALIDRLDRLIVNTETPAPEAGRAADEIADAVAKKLEDRLQRLADSLVVREAAEISRLVRQQVRLIERGVDDPDHSEDQKRAGNQGGQGPSG